MKIRSTSRASTKRRRRLLKRALVVREQALGASHPEVAWDLNNMAILYEARESGSALAERGSPVSHDHPGFRFAHPGYLLSACGRRKAFPAGAASLNERNDFESPSPAPAGDLTSRDDNVLARSARWIICKLINDTL